MAPGLRGALCGAAAGRAAAALQHVLHVCVGKDGGAAAAVLTAACALSVVCGLLPRDRRRFAVRLKTVVPVVTAVLLLWRYWPAVVRLLAGQLLLASAAGRLPRLLPWTLVSLLLAGAECCWLAARAPALPALVFAGVAACTVGRCAEWRQRVLADGLRRLPLGAPAASSPQRPPSLWKFVLRLPVSHADSGEEPCMTRTGDRAAVKPGPAFVPSACLPLAAVPVLFLIATLCECMFPWDALVFHSRTSAVQLLQLAAMWTGLQAVWLCPLIVLQTAAGLVLREASPRLAWWPAVKSGSVSSIVSALTTPASGWLRRVLGPSHSHLSSPLLCLGCLAAAAAAGGPRLLLWTGLLSLSGRLEQLSGLPPAAAALAGRVQLACCAVLLQPEMTSLDVYRTWEELQFLPVLLPVIGVITWSMDAAVSRMIPGERLMRIGTKVV